MTLDFNDFYVQAFARVMAQRLRDAPHYLVTVSLAPMVDAVPLCAGSQSFTACRAVVDDFGSLVQVTPWL